MRTIAAWIACLAGAAFLMHYELHTDDTGVEVAFLFALALMLGVLHPRRPWQWGILLGLCIPLSDLLFGNRIPGLVLIGLVTTGIALAGSYAGAFAVRALSRSQPG
jgi:hypothetical protein